MGSVGLRVYVYLRGTLNSFIEKDWHKQMEWFRILLIGEIEPYQRSLKDHLSDLSH